MWKPQKLKSAWRNRELEVMRECGCGTIGMCVYYNVHLWETLKFTTGSDKRETIGKVKKTLLFINSLQAFCNSILVCIYST